MDLLGHLGYGVLDRINSVINQGVEFQVFNEWLLVLFRYLNGGEKMWCSNKGKQ